jgi:hypothetical protein
MNHPYFFFLLILRITKRTPTIKHSDPMIRYMIDKNIFLEPNKFAVDKTKYLEEPNALIS